jgi:putative ABC transport system permease protein
LIIAFSGSIFGIVGGILLGWGIAALMKIDFTMPWNAVFWAVLITFITAMASGLYPAFKASRANPIEILHYE